ncbi:aminotransferase class I/II-fold pyridoxal phosphate-dependent enzyme [Alkaliphilus hydrothermalis]|uniref:Arginine decarboxylase n=1 Tax=Alkaliphilus hydrothermalis TaxID=1482730 RepID=A0ABS2NPE4_9FIRM|nr:aminotransferase class I/II-fold pyridoxal phosphate-dependent enzyme [Alkaliphilus hydrothermalis]MBM7614736.1 arginine decarboxylase [Alkaliphilus hydrothermalis]
MKNTLLLDQLIKIQQQQMISFHMPGHKNGRIFERLPYKNFKNILTYIDTTEISGTDNLHHPKGAIKKAQERASRLMGSEETFFLVNGSTSGIYSMIMAVTNPGDKVIIGRNCHKAVINGLILGDCIPCYLAPTVDPVQGIALEITPASVERMLLEQPDAKAVVITYPTYHGVASDLKKIAEIVHKYDKILLVDEAHGAHLGLSEALPKTALECGADIVVQSTHKTLPAFTQSSMLHIQGSRVDRDKLKFMLRLHQSSSPSYLLMASLDVAMTIYESHGKELMGELLNHVKEFKSSMKEYEGVVLFDEDDFSEATASLYTLDPTKLWISLQRKGISGVQLEEELRSTFGIQMELSNLYGVLGIGTIGNEKKDFIQLAKAIEGINSLSKTYTSYTTIIGHNVKSPLMMEIPQWALTPKEALYREKRTVRLQEAIGLISGTTITPYPPGIPILMPGEVINKGLIQYIKAITSMGMEVIGLKDDTQLLIDVIK